MPLLADQSAGLFTALGIDWRTLAFQAIAFLLVTLGAERWIYPPLVKAIDTKRQQFEDTERLKQAAQQALADAQDSANKIVAQAYADAKAARTSADHEATALMQAARDKADVQAKRIVAEGHLKLERDVAAARHDLKKDTAELVAAATATILQRKLTGEDDERLVASGLEVEQ